MTSSRQPLRNALVYPNLFMEMKLEQKGGVEATHECEAHSTSLRAGGVTTPRSGSRVLESTFFITSPLLSVDMGDCFNHDPLIPVYT